MCEVRIVNDGDKFRIELAGFQNKVKVVNHNEPIYTTAYQEADEWAKLTGWKIGVYTEETITEKRLTKITVAEKIS